MTGNKKNVTCRINYLKYNKGDSVMKLHKSIAVVLTMLLVLSFGTSLSAKEWDLDKAHSTIGFSINHFYSD